MITLIDIQQRSTRLRPSALRSSESVRVLSFEATAVSVERSQIERTTATCPGMNPAVHTTGNAAWANAGHKQGTHAWSPPV